MKYNTLGLTKNKYEDILNKKFKEELKEYEDVLVFFGHLEIQERYLKDAFKKATCGRLIRMFQKRIFETGYWIWRDVEEEKIKLSKMYVIKITRLEEGRKIAFGEYIGVNKTLEFSTGTSEPNIKSYLDNGREIEIDYGGCEAELDLNVGAEYFIRGNIHNFFKKADGILTLCAVKITKKD